MTVAHITWPRYISSCSFVISIACGLCPKRSVNMLQERSSNLSRDLTEGKQSEITEDDQAKEALTDIKKASQKKRLHLGSS